ncbi:MAG: hypothetical protein M3M88_07810 [Thermoproteota archaeon]|nr:hypothetical protein [Thermoproteota archaeon]
MLDGSISKNYVLRGLSISSSSIDKANVATYLGVYAHPSSTAPATATVDCMSYTHTLK